MSTKKKISRKHDWKFHRKQLYHVAKCFHRLFRLVLFMPIFSDISKRKERKTFKSESWMCLFFFCSRLPLMQKWLNRKAANERWQSVILEQTDKWKTGNVVVIHTALGHLVITRINNWGNGIFFLCCLYLHLFPQGKRKKLSVFIGTN